MIEYDEVVHVETLEEYLTVMEKWFKKGYDWWYGSTNRKQQTHTYYFTKYNVRYLILEGGGISHSTGESLDTTKAISFKEFMDNELGKVTYDVSDKQMTFIKEAKDSAHPATYIVAHEGEYMYLFSWVTYGTTFERDLLKYIAGDESVVFQLKEPLYRLKGNESDGETVYFKLNVKESPSYTYDKSAAFVAPQEEITRWKSPFWEMEEVKEGN